MRRAWNTSRAVTPVKIHARPWRKEEVMTVPGRKRKSVTSVRRDASVKTDSYWTETDVWNRKSAVVKWIKIITRLDYYMVFRMMMMMMMMMMIM